MQINAKINVLASPLFPQCGNTVRVREVREPEITLTSHSPDSPELSSWHISPNAPSFVVIKLILPSQGVIGYRRSRAITQLFDCALQRQIRGKKQGNRRNKPFPNSSWQLV